MSDYKHHHKVLKLLSDRWLNVYGKDKHIDSKISKPNSYSIDEIHKVTGISTKDITLTLFDLKDLDLVKYIWSTDKFVPTQQGITKSKSKYFKHKRDEYCDNRFKNYLSYIVSILAIFTFFITTVTKCTTRKENNKKLETLQESLNNMEGVLNETLTSIDKNRQTFQDSLKVYKTYINNLKSDSLKKRRNQ